MADKLETLRRQLEAGRALVSLSQNELADIMGAKNTKISRAESGKTKSYGVLFEIRECLETLGVIFLESGGVDISRNRKEVLVGNDCYLQLLGKIMTNQDVDELLIMYASDAVSPKAVDDCYIFMRNRGVKMRQLICEGDTIIKGKLDEYRTIPKNYFTNVVNVIYENSVAIVSGDEKRVDIHHDAVLAERERKVFNYFWEHGARPEFSTAEFRFET